MDRDGNIVRVPEDQKVPAGFEPISEIEERIMRQTKKAERPARLEEIRQPGAFCNARGPKGLKCRRLAHRGNHRSLDGREWQQA